MYGFNNQTIDDLLYDLNKLIKLNPSHISAYSLIIEENTKLYINNYKNIDEDLERKMYDLIVTTLNKYGYNHYEISNFSKKNYESKHNLVYWNNNHYYGFGLGASGYIDNIRYENTRSLNNYLNGKYVREIHNLSKDEILQNELMLGLRKINGINKSIFKEKFNFEIDSLPAIKDLKDKKLLSDNKNNIFINKDYIYTSNEILIKLIDIHLPKQ